MVDSVQGVMVVVLDEAGFVGLHTRISNSMDVVTVSVFISFAAMISSLDKEKSSAMLASVSFSCTVYDTGSQPGFVTRVLVNCREGVGIGGTLTDGMPG